MSTRPKGSLVRLVRDVRVDRRDARGVDDAPRVGDGLLVVFSNAVSAVRSALSIQNAMGRSEQDAG